MERISNPTVLDIIKSSTELLSKKNIANPRLNVELMLCEVLDCDRVKLYLDFEKPLTKNELDLYREWFKRRLNHEPLQYITGHAYFYGYRFKVNEYVLIPRQETEILVEKVLEDIKNYPKENLSILEIGTGSGCISIALGKKFDELGMKYNIVAIDISKEALDVAAYNLEKIEGSNEKISFVEKDIFEIDTFNKDIDYIVSNPPYIPYVEFEGLNEEVNKYEPTISLTDYKDGLTFYRKILGLYSSPVITGKLFFEIAYNKKKNLENLLKDFPNITGKFFKDYSDNDRVLEVSK
ncbi:MAG: peptide chain release factor N(5)-glutamine methyltransferase [Ignavibacteria bacterium]|nr:peptide chain release factor N(5)-glutamine methyltransferase [Ignavibacteria bacterium]